MKVFVVVILFFGYVSARGSGPYLPRGWKPDGPAFFLPSEIIKPSTNPNQEAFIEDTETSGSDALREYGPPKLETFVNINQGLPDVSTEQVFFIEVKNELAESVKKDTNIEINTEQAVAILEEVTTATDQATGDQDTQISIVQPTELSDVEATVQSDVQPTELSLVQSTAQSDVQSTELADIQATILSDVQAKKIFNAKVTELSSEEATELSNVQPTIQILDITQVETVSSPGIIEEKEIVVPTVIGEQVVPTAVVEELVVPEVKEIISAVEEVISEKVNAGVTNIADALVNLNNEVKANEDKAVENVAEIISTQVTSGFLDQAPEGFLEYGPPGFTEYGPPKLDELAQLAAEKPSTNPNQEAFIEDTETSGSDALREYGPPKLETFVNINQGLPDVSTEQVFFIEVKNELAESVKKDTNIEINTEQAVAILEEVTTATDQATGDQDTQISIVQPTELSDVEATVQSDVQPTELSLVQSTAQSDVQSTELADIQATILSDVQAKKIFNAKVTELSSEEATELSNVQPTIQILDITQVETVSSPGIIEEKEIVVPTVIGEQVVPTAVVEELVVPEVKEIISAVEEVISEKVNAGVTNIADALVNLNNEVKANEDKAVENVAEIISTQVTSGFLDQAPEGFLEYGPPGFTEYGPPKLDELAQLAAEPASVDILENNEVRRRRFSPKFRSTRKH